MFFLIDRANRSKLEIAGIRIHYSISVTDSDMDTSGIVTNWIDETNNKSYNNIFQSENPCTFMGTIKQENEFFFA